MVNRSISPHAMEQSLISPTKHTQVCIVEDDRDIRYFYTKTCESEKYKVFSTSDKEETLALIDDNVIDLSNPTIWLLDWYIPPDTAIDLVRELLCRNIAGPFILITACENTEFDDIFSEKLTKPVTIRRLLDTVRKYVQ